MWSVDATVQVLIGPLGLLEECDFPYFVSKSHLKCPLNVQLDTNGGTQAYDATHAAFRSSRRENDQTAGHLCGRGH
jgi:hypothetical protein